MNEDLKKLLDHSVEYATELLLETGEAYPFAAYIDTIGNVHPLEMEIDEKKVPQIQKVIDSLTIYCQEEMTQNRMRSYCLSYEVKIKLEADKEIDAIAFEMIHQTEKNIPRYYLPFKSKLLSKKEREAILAKDPLASFTPEENSVMAEIGEIFAVR